MNNYDNNPRGSLIGGPGLLEMLKVNGPGWPPKFSVVNEFH